MCFPGNAVLGNLKWYWSVDFSEVKNEGSFGRQQEDMVVRRQLSISAVHLSGTKAHMAANLAVLPHNSIMQYTLEARYMLCTKAVLAMHGMRPATVHKIEIADLHWP